MKIAVIAKVASQKKRQGRKDGHRKPSVCCGNDLPNSTIRRGGYEFRAAAVPERNSLSGTSRAFNPPPRRDLSPENYSIRKTHPHEMNSELNRTCSLLLWQFQLEALWAALNGDRDLLAGPLGLNEFGHEPGFGQRRLIAVDGQQHVLFLES